MEPNLVLEMIAVGSILSTVIVIMVIFGFKLGPKHFSYKYISIISVVFLLIFLFLFEGIWLTRLLTGHF